MDKIAMPVRQAYTAEKTQPAAVQNYKDAQYYIAHEETVSRSKSDLTFRRSVKYKLHSKHLQN